MRGGGEAVTSDPRPAHRHRSPLQDGATVRLRDAAQASSGSTGRSMEPRLVNIHPHLPSDGRDVAEPANDGVTGWQRQAVAQVVRLRRVPVHS